MTIERVINKFAGSMGFKDSRFVKPSAGFVGPSCHLYVSGIGHQLRTNHQDLVTFFARFGQLEDVEGDGGVYMPEGKRFIFVTYRSVQDAAHVFGMLSTDPSIPAINAHNLLVRYACLATPKGVIEPECTSTTDNVIVPGALVIPDFLSMEEEQHLLDFYNNQEWKISLQRRVQHYGYIFNYRTLMVDYVRPCPSLPDHVPPLAERMYDIYDSHLPPADQPTESIPTDCVARVDRDELRINQLTVNEYLPGQGIAPHIDTEACFGPVLLIVNLGADTVMALTKL